MIVSLISLLISFIPAMLLYCYLRNLRKNDPEYVLLNPSPVLQEL